MTDTTVEALALRIGDMEERIKDAQDDIACLLRDLIARATHEAAEVAKGAKASLFQIDSTVQAMHYSEQLLNEHVAVLRSLKSLLRIS